MAKKTKTMEQFPTSDVEPAKAKITTKTKTPAKRPKPTKNKEFSALEAAAEVLGETGDPMTSGELIEAMAKKGYWSSPNGQTPAATLYAAIIREIGKKGKESRFAKSERGKFERTKAR